MAMMRDNPLPIGKYWVDVFEKDSGAFRAWLANNQSGITVEKTENFLPRGDYPGRTWYLFQVTSPTPWLGPGFPTIADDGVHTSPDTVDRPPPPPSVSEQIEGAAEGVKTVAVVGGLGLLGYLFYKLFS